MTNLSGKLIETFKGGENIWMKEEEIAKCETLFNDVLQILSMIKKKPMQFVENKFTVARF